MKRLIPLLLAVLFPALLLADSGGGAGMAVGGNVLSGTSCSIPYFNASVQLAEDNANHCWDATNHRLGVNTTAPKGGISVGTIANYSSGLANLTVKQNGTYGSAIAIQRSSDDSVLSMLESSGKWRIENSFNSSGAYLPIIINTRDQPLYINDTSTGRVSIGTNTGTPNGRLEVRGVTSDLDASIALNPAATGFLSKITSPSNASGKLTFTHNSNDGLQIDSSGNTIVLGTLTASRTSDIGWAVKSGANTACNTTCTNACVFGQDTGTNAIVACTDATADVCVCAGAS